MHYVQYFKINGVDTKQIPCMVLRGAPNAATEGRVGALAMDVSSPTHDLYKCVAVNGCIYTWELLSSGAVPDMNGYVTQSELDNYYTKAEITALLENIESGGSPIEVATETEMTSLLTTADVGTIYKYTGESGTYENGALYIVEAGE